MKSYALFLTTIAAWFLQCLQAQSQSQAALDEDCVVSILNRTAQVRADGTWRIDNVPANFGPVRVRATCVKNGITTSGQSDFINIEANIVNGFGPFLIGNASQIPARLSLSAASPTINQLGATDQLTVVATYPSGPTANVSTAATGTNYTVSNPAIATVNQNGLVTAVASGTVIVSAINEGAVGIIQLKVMLSGADSDGDGIADDIEIANGLNPNDPVDAMEDPDGDGLTNIEELNTYVTNRLVADTDADGISDGDEVRGKMGKVTSALLADTDGDGIRDLLEFQTGSDPTNGSSFNLAQALLSLEVTPPAFVLTVNTIVGEASRQLAVIGHLKDGNTINLVSTARGTNYSSSNLQVANFGAPAGRVFGGQDGTATITVTNSGFSDTAVVTVRTFAPTALSALAIPGYANNVDVAGRYAYVAAGANGLQIVDAINPRAPVIVGSRDTPGNANDVRVVGNLAFVADGSAGLQIINVSNPVNPVIVSSVDTPGEAQDVYVSGNLVFIADGATGLQIINASNPAAPIIVGTLDTAGTAKGVAVSGNFAVVADGDPSSAVRIINISNPAAPTLAGSVAIPSEAKDLDVQGTIAYVAAFTGGFHAVDFSNPASPRIVSSLPGTAQGFVSRDVVAVGRFALAAEQIFPNVVPIVDIGNPAQPLFRTTLNFAPLGDYAGTGIAATREFVYMTGESSIVGPENGTTGNTRLFIGQYQAIEDTGGIPPQVNITSPLAGSSVTEGQSVTANVNATDDVEVAAVNLLVNGAIVTTDTAAPFQLTFTVPLGLTSVRLQAQALDFGNNVGNSAEIVLTVIPDQSPTATITAPVAGTLLFEGQTVTFTATGTDDVGVAKINFLVNGAVVGSDTSAPFETTFTVPLGATTVSLRAEAVDTVGHTGLSPIRVLPVIPDPKTTAVGSVLNPDGTVAVGATVTCFSVTGLTGTNGRFSLSGLPTIRGDLVCQASLIDGAGKRLSGASAATPPIAGGTSDVGIIQLRAGRRVLVLVDADTAGTTALVNALTAAGNQVTRRPAPEYTWTGSNPALTNFDVVIHLNGATFTAPLPVSAQTTLVSFVQNGGGFIGSQWNGFELDQGQQTAMPDLVLQHWGSTAGEENQGNYTATYSIVLGLGNHPVLAGVPSPLSFFAEANSAGTQIPFATNASVVLMRSTFGGPAVLVRQVGQGRVVNFSHAANYTQGGIVGPFILQNANIQRLYVNAVNWTSDGNNVGFAPLPTEIPLGPAPPDLRVKITSNVKPIGLVGPGIRLQFATVIGMSYRIECCEDLVAGAWRVLGENVIGTGGTVSIVDPSATGRVKCFYRVVKLEPTTSPVP